MKSEVFIPGVKEETVMKFPALVQYKDSGVIVLITGTNFNGKKYKGVVVGNPQDHAICIVGYFSESWWKGGFEMFKGVIKLANA